MAQWIKTTGETTEVAPKKGKKFKLEELQEYVGGYIERIDLGFSQNMIVNEEGKLLGLPFNKTASAMTINSKSGAHVIVGHALICKGGEF